jgi:hypothetical protein
MLWARNFIRITFQFLMGFLLLSAVSQNHAYSNDQQESKIIFIAVDGLSHDAFVDAQRRGLFKEFISSGVNIAPFPTMTDVSWTSLMRTTDLFGAVGRIKNPEAVYFDSSTQSIQGDVRDYYVRLASVKNYLGAFDVFLNPYLEALAYFPTQELPKYEIQTVLNGLQEIQNKNLVSGYIGTIDSIAHTQKDRLTPVLETLDLELRKMIQAYASKGLDVEVILVSDHGNVPRLTHQTGDVELEPIDIVRMIKKAGLNFTSELKNANDVVIPQLALGSYAGIYFKTADAQEKFLAQVRQEPWFDLVITPHSSSSDFIRKIRVRSNLGDAQITYDKNKNLYYYVSVAGNPLEIQTGHVGLMSLTMIVLPIFTDLDVTFSPDVPALCAA